jgi:hypothetical protein
VADSFETGPGPGRGAFLLAYAGVFLAGILGALIGYGIADIGSHGNEASTTATAVGAIVGAVIAAAGAGFIAVVALRAMAEWRRPRH